MVTVCWSYESSGAGSTRGSPVRRILLSDWIGPSEEEESSRVARSDLHVRRVLIQPLPGTKSASNRRALKRCAPMGKYTYILNIQIYNMNLARGTHSTVHVLVSACLVPVEALTTEDFENWPCFLPDSTLRPCSSRDIRR